MISLYVGKLGAGKSYSATKQVWKLIHQGKNCYVNWQIDFTKYFEKKRKSLWYRLWNPIRVIGKIYYWETLEDLYTLKNGEVFFDESHMAIDARDFKSLPKNFKTKLTQSRKYGLNLHFISQHQGQVDVYVKRLCNEIVVRSGFWRFFLWRSYDSKYMDTLDNPAYPPAKSNGFGFYWFSKKFAGSYNTMELFAPIPEKITDPMWDAQKIVLEQQEARRLLRASKNFKARGGDINGSKIVRDQRGEIQGRVNSQESNTLGFSNLRSDRILEQRRRVKKIRVV